MKKPVMVYLLLMVLMSLSQIVIQRTAWAQSETITPISPTIPAGHPVSKSKEAFSRKLAEPTKLIRIGDFHFDPLHRIPKPKGVIKRIQSYAPDQAGYYIVQFDGPILPAWKDTLRRNGAEILDYLPDFSFIVRVNPNQKSAIQAIPNVRWMGIFQPSYRIANASMGKLYSRGGGGAGTISALRVNLFPGVDLSAVETRISSLGGSVKQRNTTKLKTTLEVEIPADRIGQLPAINGVKWVEPTPVWKLFNDVSTDIMRVRDARDTYGLYGNGQTVGVADTGLDQGSTSPANLHDDFENGSGASRVIQIIDRVPLDETGVDESDVNGHGTHVAGSVLGNGAMSGSDPTSNSFPSSAQIGMAPRANLIFQALEDNDSGYLSGIPADLNALFSQADAAGAHLHTNSWGAIGASSYTLFSQDVDEYVWNNPNFLILYAAGNEGADLDADGVVDLYSISNPATAKNCLTVGASEGDRPSGAGADTLWGTIRPLDYPVNPINSDHVSNNDRGMAAFSSRGPCLDGRYKPDLVAPGTNILSTRTQAISASTPIGWGNFNNNYVWMGGTSMATPLVAGTAALMREYLITQIGIASPSAALIKAALINSAEDISPGQYGTGATQEIPDSPVPNNVEGWGRVSLSDGIFPVAPFDIFYYDRTTGLNTNESHSYSFTVTDSNAPLKINLVWTDYPGSPTAQGGLVNDLDLEVTNPSTTIFYPDNALQSSPTSTIIYDTDNVVGWAPNNYAVRFTPASYPAYITSTTFWYINNNTSTNADVVVYGDNGGLPDTANELFRETLTYVPTGIITIPLNLTISSGDIHIAIERADDSNFGMALEDTNPTGRTSLRPTSAGSVWTNSAYTAWIRANVRYSPDFSTQFDRVNNTVGITLNTPEIGTYTIRVAGNNIPFGPQNYALVASGNISTILTGTVSFSSATYTIDESSAGAVILVQRTGGSDGAASVTYSTNDGTAVAGSDYTSVSGRFDWADGDNTDRTFTVPILDDSTEEPSETINLTLSNASGAPLGSISNAVLTINANDSPGVLGFSSPSYTVDENTGGSVTITVRRTGGSEGDASVEFSTSDGTATQGEDYTMVSGTFNWTTGDSTDRTFTVPIINDNTQEGDETINLFLTNASGATMGGMDTAVLTITANDNSTGPAGASTTSSSGGGGGGGCFIETVVP